MFRMKRVSALLVAAGLVSAVPAPGFAQASELDELKAQLKALQEKVERLEDQQRKAAEAKAAEAQPTGPQVKANVPPGTPAASTVTVGTTQSPLSINVGGGTVTLYG